MGSVWTSSFSYDGSVSFGAVGPPHPPATAQPAAPTPSPAGPGEGTGGPCPDRHNRALHPDSGFSRGGAVEWTHAVGYTQPPPAAERSPWLQAARDGTSHSRMNEPSTIPGPVAPVPPS